MFGFGFHFFVSDVISGVVFWPLRLALKVLTVNCIILSFFCILLFVWVNDKTRFTRFKSSASSASKTYPNNLQSTAWLLCSVLLLSTKFLNLRGWEMFLAFDYIKFGLFRFCLMYLSVLRIRSFCKAKCEIMKVQTTIGQQIKHEIK